MNYNHECQRFSLACQDIVEHGQYLDQLLLAVSQQKDMHNDNGTFRDTRFTSQYSSEARHISSEQYNTTAGEKINK